MKKLVAVVLLVCVMMSWAVAEEPGHFLVELLDQMDLETLKYVKGEVEKEIIERRAESALDPDNTGIWEKAYYVDEFNAPTDSAYIRNKTMIKGTFSNSATNNSLVNVRLLIDERPAIMLWEYGSNQVKNSVSSTRQYQIIIKDESGEKTSFFGSIPSKGDRIFPYSSENDAVLIDMLKKPQVLNFYIEDMRYGNDKYRFDVDTIGFANIYAAVFGK